MKRAGKKAGWFSIKPGLPPGGRNMCAPGDLYARKTTKQFSPYERLNFIPVLPQNQFEGNECVTGVAIQHVQLSHNPTLKVANILLFEM
jgi:hypothetical protein